MWIKFRMVVGVVAAFSSCFFADCAEPRGEPWATKPFAEWPQVVLTNSARFRGHTSLNGASAFLLRAESGEVFGATAHHLLGENGGVAPEVSLARLDDVLEAWTLFPRTKPDEQVHVVGLGPISAMRPRTDWLILRVDQKSASERIYPLRLRTKPVEIGETVFLVGVSYAEPDVAQKVYSGKVTQRVKGDRFRFDILPHVDIRGFSGAPVVDKDGLVVGVTSIWFDPKMDGELWTESGAEGVSAIIKTLNMNSPNSGSSVSAHPKAGLLSNQPDVK